MEKMRKVKKRENGKCFRERGKTRREIENGKRE